MSRLSSTPPIVSPFLTPALPPHTKQNLLLQTQQREGFIQGGLKAEDAYYDALQDAKEDDKNVGKYEQNYAHPWKEIHGYSPVSTPLNNIQEVAKWVNRIPGKLRSMAMGSIRGAQINHRHILNPLMPGIQSHINKLKHVDRVDQVKWQGKMIDVPFVHYTIPKAKSKDGRFHIALFGDPGFANGTLDYNVHAARAFAKLNDEPIDAVFLTGDLLYASNEHDRKSSFLTDGDVRSMGINILRPYQSFFKEKTPVFTCLGNNDFIGGHAEALLNYMNLPHNYQITFGDAIDVFVLDEESFSQSDAESLDKKFKTDYYTQESDRLATIQQHWLVNAMEASKEEYPNRRRIILKHFPANGVADAGRDKFYMYARLMALGSAYWQADGILTGHEHHYANVGLTQRYDLDKYDAQTTKASDLFNSPLAEVVPQITLGSSSHVESLQTKDSSLNQDAAFVSLGERNRVMPPFDTNMLALYTGFLWLSAEDSEQSDDGDPHAVSYFVQPPMDFKPNFWGSRVMPGIDTVNNRDQGYHPNNFAVIDRVELKRTPNPNY